MPTYTFICQDCGKEFEELVPRFGDIAPCPGCKSANVQRQVAAPAARVGQRLQDKRDSSSGCGPATSFG